MASEANFENQVAVAFETRCDHQLAKAFDACRIQSEKLAGFLLSTHEEGSLGTQKSA